MYRWTFAKQLDYEDITIQKHLWHNIALIAHFFYLNWCRIFNFLKAIISNWNKNVQEMFILHRYEIQKEWVYLEHNKWRSYTHIFKQIPS